MHLLFQQWGWGGVKTGSLRLSGSKFGLLGMIQAHMILSHKIIKQVVPEEEYLTLFSGLCVCTTHTQHIYIHIHARTHIYMYIHVHTHANI